MVTCGWESGSMELFDITLEELIQPRPIRYSRAKEGGGRTRTSDRLRQEEIARSGSGLPEAICSYSIRTCQISRYSLKTTVCHGPIRTYSMRVHSEIFLADVVTAFSGSS